MLRNSVFEQDHVNIVVKVRLLLMRWFFFRFNSQCNKSADTFRAPASLRKKRMTAGRSHMAL